MTYSRIVVPIDGSKHAEHALEAAISLIKSLSQGAELTILHINPTLSMNEPPVGVNVDERLEEEGKQLIESSLKKLEASGISYDALTRSGDPANMICKLAEERLADLIIMGSRGLGLVSELLIGSVSHHVVQHAHCPVMIVR